MRIRGIIPALHTAFDARGEFDPLRQRALVDRLIAQGVHGLFVAGSTGEFPLLSGSERERLLGAVVEAAAGRVPVVAHVGHLDLRKAVRLARQAARAGAAAVACLPPFYYRHRVEEVLEHCGTVAAAAASIPFYAYHIPEMTGVPMTPELLAGYVEIPTFAGLKWSDPDLEGLRRTVEVLGESADVLSGCDEMLLPALASGARGAVGSTYNYLAPWFVALWNAQARGDLEGARRYQARAARVIALVAAGGLSAGKAATRWAGTDCGEPRAPLRRYSGAEIRALEAGMEAADLPRGGLAAEG